MADNEGSSTYQVRAPNKLSENIFAIATQLPNCHRFHHQINKRIKTSKFRRKGLTGVVLAISEAFADTTASICGEAAALTLKPVADLEGHKKP